MSELPTAHWNISHDAPGYLAVYNGHGDEVAWIRIDTWQHYVITADGDIKDTGQTINPEPIFTHLASLASWTCDEHRWDCKAFMTDVTPELFKAYAKDRRGGVVVDGCIVRVDGF